MSDNRKKDVLPEFQAFFLDKKLAQENAVIEFIETMKSYSNVSDWQIRQAGDAIRLYYFHYRGFKPENLLAGKSFDFAPELLKEAKRLIRSGRGSLFFRPIISRLIRVPEECAAIISAVIWRSINGLLEAPRIRP